MAKRTPQLPANESYRSLTLRPLYCLIFIAPMLVVFHAGTIYYGTNLLAVRHIDKILKYFGATAAYLPAVAVVVVLLIQHAVHRPCPNRWKIQPKVFAGMFAESIVWMIPLIGMGLLAGKMVPHQAGATSAFEGVFQNCLMAFGAGIYEEFLFRLMFIHLTLLIFVDIFGLRKEVFVFFAIGVGAALFSLYHFSVAEISNLSSFPWPQFIFRLLAGVYLGLLFVLRGFGIAVGAHAFFDLWAHLYQA